MFRVFFLLCVSLTGIRTSVLERSGLSNSITKDTAFDDAKNYALPTNGVIDENVLQKYMRMMEHMNETNYDVNAMKDLFPGYGTNWMVFPGGDGKPRIISLEPDQVGAKIVYVMETSVTFHLYTRKNPTESQLLKVNHLESIKNSNLDLSKDIKIISHGWISSKESDICQKVKNAYLKTEDLNVICVDWHPIAKNPVYMISAQETKNVGKYVAKMVGFLVENGASSGRVHLLGHSLGAHVSGYAGQYYMNGRIGRITGFDPAMPLFLGGTDQRLDATDAEFVDVIHTCSGILGYPGTMGHVDFYPNDGVPPQPGCAGPPSVLEACSHSRSYEYYVEAIYNRHSFLSVECKSFLRFKTGMCKGNEIISLGPDVPRSARGIYYLSTNKKSLYARGNPSQDEKIKLFGLDLV